jgi:hypothetical protein
MGLCLMLRPSQRRAARRHYVEMAKCLRDARYEDATQGGGLDTFEKILVRLPPCERLGFGTDLIE